MHSGQEITLADTAYHFLYILLWTRMNKRQGVQERWKSLFVFEAPIDPMSFIALYLNDWKALNYLSLDGVGVKVLEGFPYKCKDIKTIYICTDSDKVGNDAVNHLLESIPEYMTVIRQSPYEKDLSKVLKQEDKLPDEKYLY